MTDTSDKVRNARMKEIRKFYGIPDPPPPYVPLSKTLVSDAMKRVEREAGIAMIVGTLGATCGALVLFAVNAPGVVVALGTMAVGQVVGLIWLKYRKKNGR